ncbi:T9SS type B sorting domain-containing protein [Spongiivirga citrea]|uniref:T9SS type B sorting domain-containing protein n=1 Tax=Spongiivirga citrea TaxID=1481457 RepID=A0A6M0CLX8_9FLAO|nr:T9SS type B sorting domain-containing protein [Spongiivirga citrea]NER18662.1 T9SS type B sorting domain-containing protein [Spongiivirga citrea]
MRFTKKNVFVIIIFSVFISALFAANKLSNSAFIPFFEQENVKETISLTTAKKKSLQKAESAAVVMPNPLIAVADNIVTCPNNGLPLARFFLCGTGDSREINTGITGSTISWQLLDPTSCAGQTIDDCPNTNVTCTWNDIATGPDFTITDPGEYQLIIITNGVLERYYFKVNSNPLDPQTIKTDMVCGNDAQIEVTNIPEDYEYSLNDPNGTYQQSPIFDITTAGTYTIYVRQENAGPTACIFPTQEIIIEELDIDVDITPTDIECTGEFGAIAIEINDVPEFYNYSLSLAGTVIDTFGPSTDNNYTFNNLNGGTYEVLVTTDDGCAYSETIDISSLSTLDLTAFATESFGCGTTTVPITANATGGTGPYQFSINGGTLQTSNILDATTPGDQTILVRDANNCEKVITYNVPDILPPEITVDKFDSNCAGADDGQILITVTNSRGYQINFSIDGGATFQNSGNFSNLAPNNYNLVIRYQTGTFVCDIVQTEAVNSATSLVGDRQIDVEATCTTGATVSFTGVIGGQAPYFYDLGSGFVTNPIFTNVSPGSYNPRIRDSNGCVLVLAQLDVTAPNEPNDLLFNIVSVDCVAGTVNVEVTSTGGGTNLTYEITAPSNVAPSQTTPTVRFDNLSLGSYTFQVTDNDSGCDYQESFAITDISSITTSGQLVQNVQCLGESQGAIRFSVSGFENTYSYTINTPTPINLNGQTDTSLDFTGLPAGTYTIQVTDDDTSCTNDATVTVQAPAAALGLTIDVDAMDCGNNNRGRVIGQGVDGWGSYQYRLTQPDATTIPGSGNFRNNRSFGNLSQSGEYILEVQDANGCIVEQRFTLTPVDLPVLNNITPATDLCFTTATGASITVEVQTGTGTAPFEYSINSDTPQASPNFTGLNPGTYTIEVIDANGCTDDVTIDIERPLSVVAFITADLQCPASSPTPAEIRINARRGYAPYGNIEVFFNSASIANIPATGSNTNYSTVNPGTYEFVITDANGCTTRSNEVIIDPLPTILELPPAVIDASCGLDNGSIEIIPDPTSGAGPFEYSLDDGINPPTPFTGQSLYPGLAAGNYTYTIRDSKNCESTFAVTINTTPALNASTTSLDETCSGGTINQGSIEVTATNGVGPYTFELFDALTGNSTGTTLGPSAGPETFSVDFGSYFVVVTDSNGCTFTTIPDIINDPADVTLTYTPPPNIDCTNTGTAYEVQIVGGTGCFEIGLAGGPLGNPNALPAPSGGACERNHSFAGIVTGSGTYLVEILDLGTGCRYFQEIVIPEPNDLNIVAAPSATPVCEGDTTGTLNFTVNDYTGNELTITVLNTDTNVIVSAANAIAVPVGTGVGTAPFTFTPAPYLNNLPVGNYQILVEETDPTSTRCGASDTFSITANPPLQLNQLTNINAGCTFDAQVVIQGTGGSGTGYEYHFVPDLTPGDTTDDTPVPGDYAATNNEIDLDPASSLNWDAWVRDSNGCETKIDITIAIDPQPVVDDITIINQCSPINNTYDVEIRIDPIVLASLTAPVTYAIIPQGLPSTSITYTNSPFFTGISPGDYTAIVRDGKGCVSPEDFTLSPVLRITAEFSTLPTCNNNDGEITVNIQQSSGLANLDFTLNDGINPPVLQSGNNVFTNLGPGNYTIDVVDTDTTCPASTSVDLDPRTIPVITSLNKTDISCNGADDGTFTVELDGASIGVGADPFTYILYRGNIPLGGPYPAEEANQTSNVFEDLDPDTYTVRVVSNQGCDAVSSDTIVEPDAFIISASNTDFTCDPLNNSFSTAEITVFPNGSQSTNPLDNTGTSPYSYSIDGGTNFQNSNIFEIVDNGLSQTFTIVARDANGCISTAIPDITIDPPNVLDIQTNVTNGITCSNDPLNPNPAVVNINVASGGGGDFIFYLTPIDPLNPLTTQDTPAGTTSANFNISIPGDYLFAVEDELGGGCRYFSQIVTVDPYDTIEASIANPTSVCFTAPNTTADSTGTVELTVTGYTGTYDYEVFLDNGTTTGITGSGDTATGATVVGSLPGANIYIEVVATATPFCPARSNNETIPKPDEALDFTAQETANVTCSNDKGVIVLEPAGGWGDYEFEVINTTTGVTEQAFDANRILTDLSAGIHQITVRDAENCTFTNTIILSEPAPIIGEIELVNGLFCPGDNDAAIQVDATLAGGEGSYIFRLNQLDATNTVIQTTGPQASSEFSNLPAGNYSIIIRDGWECEHVTQPFAVQDPEPPLVLLREATALSCIDPAELEINVTNPDPGAEYEYLISTDDPLTGIWTAMGPGVSTTMVPQPQGEYRYLIREVGAASCPSVITNQVRVDPVPALNIIPDETNANLKCAGEATAIIRAEANGGSGDYRYRLFAAGADPSVDAPLVGPQDSGIFRNLGAGNYFIQAESRGCFERTANIPVVDPVPLQAEDPRITNVNCPGGMNGSIIVEASGGTGPIQFAISNRLNEFFDEEIPGTNVFRFDDLEAGTYEIIIQDSVGCYITYTRTITEPAAIVSTFSTVPESCLGDDDGIIRIQLQGGTPPYFTTLDPTDLTSYIENQFEFRDLRGDQTYEIHVLDSQNCPQVVTVDLGVGIPLDPMPEIRYECTGTNLMNEVEVDVGSIPLNDVMFSLDGGSLRDSNVFTQLSEGDHQIRVLHRNGCERMVDFSIITADPVSVSLVETGNNVLTAMAAGGVPPYTYYVNGEDVGDDNVIIVPENGIYEVRVVDTNGCEAIDQIDYLFIDVEIPNFFSPNGDGQNDYWAPINQVSFPNIQSEIYDRYGRLIKKLAQNEKWDGRYERNSKPLPSGDYWYVIRLKDFDNREFTGHFTLLR